MSLSHAGGIFYDPLEDELPTHVRIFLERFIKHIDIVVIRFRKPLYSK